MKTVKIGGFKLGIDMRSNETEMPKGTVRDAVNVDFTLDGGFRRRRGVTKLAAFTGAHSMWSPRSQTFALFAQADALRIIDVLPGAAPGVRTVMTGLSVGDRMSYCEQGVQTVFTNGVELGIMSPSGVARFIGVTDPSGEPAVAARTSGGLAPGRYGCAYSFANVHGEESGLSPAAFIDLPDGGSIDFTLPPTPDDAVSVRLYTTPTNGDVFYQMAEAPAGLIARNIGDDTPGKIANTQFMHRMPGGSIVRMYRGRMLVVRGDVLIFSAPFNYGLTSRRHNFVQFSGAITMVEPVSDGVYVGTEHTVYFLSGTGPLDFEQTVVSTNVPVMGASTILQAAHLPDDLQKLTDAPVAVWLGRLGYSIGMNNGLVHDIQNERIDLPAYEEGSSVAYTKNGLTQVISIVQSEQSNGAGSAIDSTT